MKRHLLLIFFLLICVCARTQVAFTHAISHTNDKTITITFRGNVPEGYHVDGSVSLDNSKGVRLAGGTKKVSEGLFTQNITITAADYSFAGSFMFVACDDEKCFMPEYVEFSDKGHSKAFEANEKKLAQEKAEKEKAEKEKAAKDMAEKAEQEIAAQEKAIKDSDSLAAVAATADADTVVMKAVSDIETLIPTVKGEVRSELSESDGDAEQPLSSLLTLFFLGFIGGFAALLTPCVWPIIPLTVSFFLKKKRGVKDAMLFGGCIITMFLALGITVTAAFGASAMNELSTSAVFNVVCFVALLLLGLSMMGLFTLTLPSSFANKTDEMAEKSTGIISILFMSLTLVIVSFSCTAPIMGVLLVQVATDDSILAPMVGLTGFALALALPFTLFALFPSLMKRFRISGQWLQVVKVTLGVLETAFSLKFLSVADQAYGWDILPRTPFLIIWSALFAFLAYYLFATLRGRKRLLLALIPALFTVYLVQGIFTHETSFVSAFVPIDKDADNGKFSTNDFYEGQRLAKEHNRRIFLDFTGYGCVNCRKMEGAVFTDSRVRTLLDNEFVMVHLYVDDRTPLPEILSVNINGKEQKLRTVGDRWSLFERHSFASQSQPLYVILSPDAEILSPTYGYNEDIQQFLDFLNNAK